MRSSIAAFTLLTTVIAMPAAEACWLTDCLFGRRASPYAVGYAPAVPTPYVTAYPPTVVTTVPNSVAGVAYPSTTTYQSAYPTAATTTTMNSRPAYTASGVYQTQRPAYVDNPSVYTGQPVTAARPVYRAPLSGLQQSSGSTFVSPLATTSYSANYGANYAATQAPATMPGQPIQITTPTGTPATALPATPVAPLFQTTNPTPPGGLRRFFGSLFGTNYRSSYYRAPVTFYRPVTAIDPVSGANVTYQQPCLAYTQRLQRTPVTSFQLGQPIMAQPLATAPSTCPTPGATTIPGGTYQGQTYGLNNGTIGQASGISGGQVTTIPSTTSPAPNYGYGPATEYGGSTYPSGPPATSPFGSNPNADRQDLQQVEQPRLESARPQTTNPSPTTSPSRTANPESTEPSGPANGSNGPSNQPSQQQPYWELQSADDSTAMIRRPLSRFAPTATESIGIRRSNAQAAEPIRAPDDYVSPFRTRRETVTQPPARDGQFEAPPLPERSVTDPRDLTSVSTTTSPPAREAAWIRTRPIERTQPVSPPKRDNTWIVGRP